MQTITLSSLYPPEREMTFYDGILEKDAREVFSSSSEDET